MIDFRKEYSNGNLNAENFKKIEKLSSSILQEHFKILDHYIKAKGLSYGGQYHYTLWTYLHGSNKNMINSSAILMEILVFKHLKFIDDEEAVNILNLLDSDNDNVFIGLASIEHFRKKLLKNSKYLLERKDYIIDKQDDLLKEYMKLKKALI